VQTLLTQLPENFPCALLVVQHMPASFASSFAQQLNRLCKIHVKEAEDGDILKPATALLAPGGKQMLLRVKKGRAIVHLRESEPGEIYKPSVDLTFNSIANLIPEHTLALILTGMGEDGVVGCRNLKAGGALIWTQDEASCVVYGMPAAVVDEGLSDKVLPLNAIGKSLLDLVQQEETA